MGIRIFSILGAVMLIAGGSSTGPDAYLERLHSSWSVLDDSALRVAISTNRTVNAAIMWESSGERIFPAPGEITLMTQERMLDDIALLNTLRASSDGPVWDRISKTSDRYYHCAPLWCFDINGRELAIALGLGPEDHVEFMQEAPDWRGALLAIMAACALLVFGVSRRLKVKELPAADAASHPVDPEGFTFGHARINPGHLVAQIEGVSSDLSSRDLALIRFFHRNPTTVHSKDTLYNEGWGRDFHANSRALEQHISTLRRKLDPNNTHAPVIETVHGRGYRYSG